MRNLKLASIVLVAAGLFYLTACDNSMNNAPGLEDSFELFTGLEPIAEANNMTLLVNQGRDIQNDAYFKINISDVMPNEFIKNTTADAWCLEWNKPLRSNNDVHTEVKAFATETNDKWKPLNYLFSIENELKAKYPEEGILTYREMQAVIWTLAGYMGIAPEFNVDQLSDSELPSRLRDNGRANFHREIVRDISNLVLENYSSGTITTSGFALQTADDQQNIIVPDPTGITTNEVTDITPATAVSGGEIQDAGDLPITQKGVCWSTDPNPTTDDSCTNDGTGPDDFVSNMTGLTSSTTYYVRAYAINEAGTMYGNQRTFTTGIADEVTRELAVCDQWSASQSGGFGVTIDTWNIEDIPVGATFDMEFQAFSVPDKFVVEYPVGNVVHDTGWRGSPGFDGNPLYPGGVISPGSGTVFDMFTKGAQNTFRVVVTGPAPGTLWNYRIRCRPDDPA